MTVSHSFDSALVSVIIPCYNHGKYLLQAIESIWAQDYPAVEIVVVDDGSEDNTKEIAENAEGIVYVYQQNKGLSAARNLGIENAKGEFLVFLDADDWLLPKALSTNSAFLVQNPTLAFVSGAHDKVYEKEGRTQAETWEVTQNHYLQLLQSNYIGMHATVMFRRWVFQEFRYDTSLNSCEDYDLYLNVSRKYPVLHHTTRIAAYRLHTSNMSGDIVNMLDRVLHVLRRQKKNLVSPEEQAAYAKGEKVWKEYYCHELYKKGLAENKGLNLAEWSTLFQYEPLKGLKYLLKKVL